MDEYDALPELRRLGVHLCGVLGSYVGECGAMSLLFGARNRPSYGVESLEDNARMGEHEEGPRSAESGPDDIGSKAGAFYRRPYAVANISHRTITFLCGRNAAEVVGKVRVNDNDVIWWTTRIKPVKTHLHDGNGACIPKIFKIKDAGVYLAR